MITLQPCIPYSWEQFVTKKEAKEPFWTLSDEKCETYDFSKSPISWHVHAKMQVGLRRMFS
jgi:hypothetical protein